MSGAALGARGLLAGAEAGAVFGPAGGIAGALLGGLIGASLGCQAGSRAGEVLDRHVLGRFECMDCGHTFNDDDSSQN